MTADDLRALLDAATKATPGPARDSVCGLSECEGKRECESCFMLRTYDPVQKLAAACDPATVAALARIALAAVEVYQWGEPEDHMRLAEALRDAGILTAPQETI